MPEDDIVKRIKSYFDKKPEPKDEFEKLKIFYNETLAMLKAARVPYSSKEEDDDYQDYLLSDDENSGKKKVVKFPKVQKSAGKKATTSVVDDDVDERIASISNKLRQKKGPTTERAKRKREAKKLKNSKPIKKLLHSTAIVTKQNLQNAVKLDENLVADTKEETAKKAASKILFSKLDFAANAGSKKTKSHQNPREILKKLIDTKKQIIELKETGESSKAEKVQNDIAWKKAFDKMEGKKVKDDVQLLKKTIKKRKIEKKSSKTKWTERKQRVEKDIAKRQKKREENLDKRSKDKKNKKLKKATKKGRIIPGY